jgi:hypothetical protein
MKKIQADPHRRSTAKGASLTIFESDDYTPRRSEVARPMKIFFLKLTTVAVAMMALSGVVFPHHGTAAYDATHTVTVKGTATDFQFRNPHVLLSFEVKGDNGKIEKWEGEITTPSQLAREGGWTKNSIKPGDQIAVTGNRAKNGSPTMIIKKVVLSDGTELRVGGGRADN